MCALLVTGTVLAGCAEDPNEGTNGVGRLPAEKIQSRTRAAAESAGAVRVHGSVVSGGRTYALDMRLKADGGTGSVTTQGATFRLLRVGEQLFVKADAEFWSHGSGQGEDGKGDAAAASKLGGKFVKVPQGDPSYKKFSGFTDKAVLLDGLLTLHGALATDGHDEQAGVRTIRVTGDKGSGGTLEVSLEGKPYPLRLERAGGAGTLTFSAWGQDFALKEPEKSETVDYGKQLPTS
ncbi:lipoprotein [Streptomyces lomondensis]|uniref:Lipoprotein n=2 Tax=Streptomyces lomondensis TaxID=68229 RepID=A0ABQ2WZX3_9ACTN|nr:lipoprotein [Streptomyces lomondensis]